MPHVYNTYGAKTLCSKFCKDKYNYIFDTDLLKSWLTRNPIRRFLYFKAKMQCVVGLNWDPFRRSPLTRTKFLCGLAKLRFLSPIPFNQNKKNPVCGWAKLRSLSPIPFNQNQKILCVVGLKRDSFHQSPLTRTKFVCGWVKLRFLLPILFNQNQNLMCGWAKLRFLSPIPFNQNQNYVCGWAKLRFLSPIPYN